jgi:FkbM family methyltransferase
MAIEMRMALNLLKNRLIAQVPIARLSPVETFLQRSLQKFLLMHGNKFHLSGAFPVGHTDSGNRILRLKISSALGPKDLEIEIPEDGAMYEHVRRSGSWDTLSSFFLAKGLTKSVGKRRKAVFLDIGANVGLVTLQTYNYSHVDNDFLMVEPVPNHVKALKQNTRNLRLKNKVEIFDFALAATDGISFIHTEKGNHGNSGFLSSAFSDNNGAVTEVRLKNSKDFFLDELSSYDIIVLKSDLQGMDAEVLAQAPVELWDKVERAVIEVWSLPEIHEGHVERLVNRSWKSHSFGWSQNSIGKITSDDVVNFWLNKSKGTRDLYLKRK